MPAVRATSASVWPTTALGWLAGRRRSIRPAPSSIASGARRFPPPAWIGETSRDGSMIFHVTAVAIHPEAPSTLDEYARIPISFEVRRVLDVEPREDRAGFRLTEREVVVPY